MSRNALPAAGVQARVKRWPYGVAVALGLIAIAAIGGALASRSERRASGSHPARQRAHAIHRRGLSRSRRADAPRAWAPPLETLAPDGSVPCCEGCCFESGGNYF